MKQRKYMLLAMLAAAALTMTACSNKKADVDTAEALERNYTLSMHGRWSYNTLAYKDSMDIRIFVISFSGVGYILCRLEDSSPGSSIGCCGD